MRALLRLSAAVLLMALAVAIPLMIWGPGIVGTASVAETVLWLRSTGWAAAAGVGLIVSDVFLPVPTTAAMAALGVLYGPFVGGLLAALGSVLAGSLGYWLCRALGPRTAEWLAGPGGIENARALFDRWGFPLIAVSRWIPVLPEPVAFMAGLIRLPFHRFLLALTAGAVPLGFAFATVGHLGQDVPVLIVVAAAVAPVAVIAAIRFALRRRRH